MTTVTVPGSGVTIYYTMTVTSSAPALLAAANTNLLTTNAGNNLLSFYLNFTCVSTQTVYSYAYLWGGLDSSVDAAPRYSSTELSPGERSAALNARMM